MLSLTIETPSDPLSPPTQTYHVSLPKHAHQVQFYDDEQHLFGTISHFLGPLLDESYEDGVSAVIIARPNPIQYLREQFMLRGYKSEFRDMRQYRTNELLNYFDPSTQKRRHVLLIDAHRLLETLMPGRSSLNYQRRKRSVSGYNRWSTLMGSWWTYSVSDSNI
jgi:hypothetical protein